jgi:fused signal recognition particle receptor
MGLFQKFRDGLRKTQEKLSSEIKRIVTRSPKLDADALEELEAVLISTDIGVGTASRIIEQTKEAAKQSGQVDVFAIARAEIERELGVASHGLTKAAQPPTVILLAGVNGTGKTTSTAKLAHWLKEQGNTVLLGACDTFRAAAIEQLKIWGQRVGCEVIAGQYGRRFRRDCLRRIGSGHQSARRLPHHRHRRPTAHEEESDGGDEKDAPLAPEESPHCTA